MALDRERYIHLGANKRIEWQTMFLVGMCAKLARMTLEGVANGKWKVSAAPIETVIIILIGWILLTIAWKQTERNKQSDRI